MEKIMTDNEWRMLSAESRHKINVYEKEKTEKIQALELAILNIKDALLKEIRWCRDNQNSKETQKAFIAGLEQAQRLINAAEKTLLMDERYGEGFLSSLQRAGDLLE